MEAQAGGADPSFATGAIGHIAHLVRAGQEQGLTDGHAAKVGPASTTVGGELPGAQPRGRLNGNAQAGAFDVAAAAGQQAADVDGCGGGIFRDAAKGVGAGAQAWRVINRRHINCHGHGRRRTQASVVDRFDLECGGYGQAVQVGGRGPLRGLVGSNQLVAIAPATAANRQLPLHRIDGRHLKAGDVAIAIGPIASAQQISKDDR